MDDTLLAEVLERLDRDDSLDTDTEELVLAACSGEEALGAVLGGQPVERPEVPEPSDRPEPTGAYLKSITVEGFRGIGPASSLDLVPGPGLTLVAGRNGSGKSSFAEALELLLTGDNYRWSDRSKVWREGWRNLHHAHAPSITATLTEEGVPGDTVVAGRWPPDGDLGDLDVTVQRTGQSRTDLAALGWEHDLVAFRPFLSYNELGSLLEEGPSRLYDTLESILGLEDLTSAAQRLADARLARERRLKAARQTLTPLLDALRDLDDERARACAAALSARRWNLEAVEDVLTDTGAPDGAREVDLLRRLAVLAPPDEQQVQAVIDRLREAARGSAEVAGTDAAEADRLAGLLEAAIAHHDHAGDGDCPVCGVGVLDGVWHEAAVAQASELRGRAATVAEARRLAVAALRDANQLVTQPPALLRDPAAAGVVDLGGAVEAWQRWWEEAQTDDPTGLAEHLEDSYPVLADSVEQVRKTAATELERREDRWRPVARQLHAWLAEAVPANTEAQAAPRLKAAEGWLKTTTAALRDDRFQPIAKDTINLWRLLRQHSNVELGQVVLEGAGTRRRVALEVTVDGVEGAALGVMSQGELHALALSLFLPRATLPESPFRFLVIDDPVQSMDPARVDGLARVLAAVATDRQVVVFTHDTRLPEAVRRLAIDARVVEVTRRPDSVVELRDVADPITRLLDDARAVASNDGLPEAVRARLVPGFCRLALEAACTEAYRRRQLAAGAGHADVEDALSRATRLTQKAALAIFGDVERAGDVHGRLNAICRGGANIYLTVQKGVHAGHRGTLHALIDGTDELARALQRQ